MGCQWPDIIKIKFLAIRRHTSGNHLFIMHIENFPKKPNFEYARAQNCFYILNSLFKERLFWSLSSHPLLCPSPSLQVPSPHSGLSVLFLISLDLTMALYVTLGMELSSGAWWAYRWEDIGRQWLLLHQNPSVVNGSGGRGRTLSMTDCWLGQSCAGQCRQPHLRGSWWQWAHYA